MTSYKDARKESQALAKRVGHFHQFVSEYDTKRTWHHFKDKGHSRATIYSCMSKYKDFDYITFKKKNLQKVGRNGVRNLSFDKI